MAFRLPFLRLMIQRLGCPVLAVRWGGRDGALGCGGGCEQLGSPVLAAWEGLGPPHTRV